ncbi:MULTISPECIES: undecaprenyldiphospho-muramoylpentapeptide beta-N-acetylglucosaminyltransferase [Phyllobacteriaceae]|jgi:UDP-N-acetylglucosamine--N-acetylmuramyl-(pentapeptide) pyrophosphoryl-undecaprenol N-acetylglucosamine transferase|uniref:UDP-N-acetylglucosamine--N-acetylmuramyl-(pentapeptide) pyrophosphoryl-undecaprenol N-acetylglucosamine transferase n=1 Tax=Mesorhizobium hungaricum TaxID=1566387 RepID=A0A1C2DYF1_9HYPH|nr:MULTISPECIES: undecaprenyldiphospho-muramoylpentapeptide beta-N-acetylglucosaminyltransferase [Mesorhizobium]MBN9234820.1 undecaprenyldiphospho-muramoylpentapeptide beta-N-acetylglucosaminyltransferase [Mesorhizobium sp.]MDQ0328698.1 UDP-N-acetylglucosamine--N-acetylmuramyl-(pentapeptide) pyrophosphoryl-undecaprenol N-acetylglucosamine transferase [Mesorhizobium sp. YL-MeA3-2017]OCX19772.1 undecaprenyldiphospho-muramoylpentapeptide beta-N-acetylglucosaminyltransferase [Mesorhizobium hungaricu
MAKGVILLAAGGTGGHLFPAEALAHELIGRGWAVHLATDDRASRFAAHFPATAVHTIRAATMGSKNPFALAGAMWRIWQGVRQASSVIGRIKPEVVVGFGGYPTLPPVFAATRRKVPTVIHEQNAVMGRANRALSARVDAIAGGFLPEDASIAGAKTVTTGNPVRPPVLEAAKTPYVASAGEDPFRLLVFGGSQGAQFFSDAIPAAIALLSENQRRRFSVVQQARADDVGRVKDAYARLGIEAQVSPFFTDMAQRIAAAHLVISRSGASTVSEIAVIGRPALLVPYPHALDHDQAANAAALAAAGGGEVHPQSTLTPEVVAGLLGVAMEEPERLAGMAAAAKSVGRPHAARLLADLTEAIASRRTVEEFRKDRSA